MTSAKSAKRGTSKELTQLTRRRLPVQKRGKQRVDQILDVVARLVKEEGIAKLTTNRIAERAGIPVGTIYQYFRNKSAILVALEERFISMANGVLDELIASGETSLDVIDTLIDRMVGLWRENEALALNWNVLRMEPEFAAYEDECIKEVAVRNAELLGKLGVGEPRERLMIGYVLRETIVAQLDYAATLPTRQRGKVVRELKRMIRAYLETYLAAPPGKKAVQ